MKNNENKCGSSKSFYGTFALIYIALNVFAFFIMLSTTKWDILMDDEADGFHAGVLFMVCGIAAALICGIGPALVLHNNTKKGWMYAFPSALLLIGTACAALWKLTESAIYSWIVLVCTLPAAPIYNCFVFNGSPFVGFMELGLVAISPIIYALVIYLAYCFSQKKVLRTKQA